MKCKTFTGTPEKAADLFNAWAKGKALSRDVIIHEIEMPIKEGINWVQGVTIFVYHPESDFWEKSIECKKESSTVQEIKQ